ncbi:Hypothetical protein BN2458_PEG0128 [Helicobacter typhlonius]|uniref:Uncharacterized protein n=1 Tax=Helicobacter typhlonius TaxID=76936 RepID=A0A0S4PTN2_9HELI|nr:Hypothetical protein BN2458_PEG0128 [Helicobacter typhlonius]
MQKALKSQVCLVLAYKSYKFACKIHFAFLVYKIRAFADFIHNNHFRILAYAPL